MSAFGGIADIGSTYQKMSALPRDYGPDILICVKVEFPFFSQTEQLSPQGKSKWNRF
jgi:hypothetical protein